MNSDKIYVIPDIHGRDFWHDIKKIEDYEKIIFLGDYVDPLLMMVIFNIIHCVYNCKTSCKF